GPTNVTTGTLKAGVATTGNNGAFGFNSAVTIANTAGAILDTAGFNNTIGSLSGGGATGGAVLLGANTLTVGGNNESTSFGGVIGTAATAGVLTKVGTGTLTLTGSNIYTGATNINGGLINVTALTNLVDS